ASPKEAVEFIKGRLPVVKEDEAKRITRLIAELDSDEFEVREKATAALQALGWKAEPELRRYLEAKPTVEAGRRVQQLLTALRKDGKPMATPGERQMVRLLEVLEHIGTPEAKQLLVDLAERGQGTGIRREAKSSLERLGNRAGG